MLLVGGEMNLFCNAIVIVCMCVLVFSLDIVLWMWVLIVFGERNRCSVTCLLVSFCVSRFMILCLCLESTCCVWVVLCDSSVGCSCGLMYVLFLVIVCSVVLSLVGVLFLSA